MSVNSIGGPQVHTAFDDTVNKAVKEKPGLFTTLRNFIVGEKVARVDWLTHSADLHKHVADRASVLKNSLPVGLHAAFDAQFQILSATLYSNSFQNTQAREDFGHRQMSHEALRQDILEASALANAAVGMLSEWSVEQQSALATPAPGPQAAPAMPKPVQVAPPATQAPQFIKTPGNGYAMVRKMPEPEAMVLRGGGAKGVGNGPALDMMQKNGLLDGVNTLVGTSAGALTATLMASGMNGTEFDEFAQQFDMNLVKSTPDNYGTLYPMMKGGLVGHKAGEAVRVLDFISAAKVSNYLKANWGDPTFISRLAKLCNHLPAAEADQIQIRLATLKSQDFTSDRSGSMLTFRDLAIMNALEPSQFKQLHLTGWDTSNNKSTYFNATATPDMPVAIAGRISMSIPVYFESVKYDPGDGKGMRSFTDGGVGTNMPSEVVTGELTGNIRDQSLSKTLLMTFDENGKAQTILTGNSKPLGVLDHIKGWVKNRVAGNDLQKTAAHDNAKLLEGKNSSFVTFHGTIGTFDMDADTSEVARARMSAESKSMEQIVMRRDTDSVFEVSTPMEAYSMMSPDERLALAAAHQGSAQNLSVFESQILHFCVAGPDI